jgi:NADH:ubiquinone reductase (H+-translocating)
VEPHVVIVGAGFGGLAAAKALKRARVRISLVDRSNHHLFQPLLYQVATAALSPGQIATPTRSLLRRQRNVTVFMGEVTGVDKETRRVFATAGDHEGSVEYDFLILATGVRHSYFSHPEFEPFAPGLKSLADAVLVRNNLLAAFELAETQQDPRKHQDLLTFVLVGAGPTGVEMAGAIASLIRNTLSTEFRRVDPRTAKVVLIDQATRVLPTFAEELSAAAHERLIKLGVDVRLGQGVEHIDDEGVVVGGRRIASRTVIWTAGVEPSPTGQWLRVPMDRAGRVRVQPDLTIPGHPEVFVIGDVAALEQDGRSLPGVAQVAIQQGRYAARAIERQLAGQPPQRPFRYFDKGNMAVVGKNFAVLESGKFRLTGFLAFLAWGAVHLQYLAQTRLRTMVFMQWMWMYLTNQPGSRLIIRHRDRAAAATPAGTGMR